MSDNLRSELLEIVNPIIERWRDHIGTHSETCFERHVACLAVLIRDMASDAEEAS